MMITVTAVTAVTTGPGAVRPPDPRKVGSAPGSGRWSR